MKSFIFKLLLFFLSAFVCTQSKAYDFEVDGIYYNVISAQEKTCEVVYENSNINLNRTGKISVPSSVTFRDEDLSVTRIGYRAFLDSKSVSSVELPSTITYIDHSAFENCISLTSITIPESVNILRSSAFENCSYLQSISIPSSIKTIENYTFAGCVNLTKIDLPETLTTIQDFAFNNCESLVSIDFPNNLYSIGESAFNGCKSLEALIIPASIKGIGREAFYNCNNLTKIEFQDSPNSLSLSGMTSTGKVYFALDPEGNLSTLKTGRTLVYLYKDLTNLLNLEIGDNVSVEEFNCGTNLENLIIGKNVKFQQRYEEGMRLITFHLYNKLQTLKCYDETPSYSPSFSQSQYLNVKLYVPNESVELYKSTSPWNKFWYIEGFELSTAVSEVSGNNVRQVVNIYDTNGIMRKRLTKGLNIIIYSDGTTEKKYY